MDDLGQFLQQQGILTMLTVVIVLGMIYVVMISVIIRRSQNRRRKKRDVLVATQPQGGAVIDTTAAAADKPADWTVPAELREIPEPDLDLLAAPFLSDGLPPRTDDAALEPVAEPSAANSEWITAVVPAEETAMTTTDTDNSPEGAASSGTPEMQMGDAIEVMRVWRDLSDGKLIIQMGNQRYRTLGEIQNPDMSRRFVAVVRDLWTMINGAGASRPEPLPPGSTAVGLKSRMGLLNAEPEEPLPSMFKQVIRPLNQSAKPAASEPAPGIANSVEDFLQYRLSNTPELATRSIHIRTAHNHGITIEVDGHYYDSIGDVVDPDAREFLFTMMREWEARH